MSIYTKTGDAGTTALFTGQRVKNITLGWKPTARWMN